MRDVQAERLDDRPAVFKRVDALFIDILRKEHPVLLQFIYLIDKLREFLCPAGKFLPQCLAGLCLIRLFQMVLHHTGDHVIHDVIDDMHRTAVDIQDDVVSIVFILVYQFLFLPDHPSKYEQSSRRDVSPSYSL